MQHQQRIAGRKKSSVDHGVSALARLQQQVVHEGDVQGLVVDTDGVTSSSAAATAAGDYSAMGQGVLPSTLPHQPPAKTKAKWQALRQKTSAHLGDAVRAVHDELTNTQSTPPPAPASVHLTASGAGDGGEGSGPDEIGIPTLVVSTTGQPRRRRETIPNGVALGGRTGW